MSEQLTLDEWKARFRVRIKEFLDPDNEPMPHDEEIIEAELESWLEDDNWIGIVPEHAADENITYWAD